MGGGGVGGGLGERGWRVRGGKWGEKGRVWEGDLKNPVKKMSTVFDFVVEEEEGEGGEG